MENLLPSEREELKVLEEMDLILKELHRQYKTNKESVYGYGQFLPFIQLKHPDFSDRDLQKWIFGLFEKMDDRPEGKKHVYLSRTRLPGIKLTVEGERFLLDGGSYVAEFLQNRRKIIEKECTTSNAMKKRRREIKRSIAFGKYSRFCV